ncbi:baculoviral IAP repeat-containing protein 2 [Latimeria chalumnae]|uniref:RING-type E3 ubiquitin transferase n=1 Tax=Latimeria chalumnae TaxID=7897 RepID=H2ZTN9_LATCH|nr:PREDICTED: baculoviral IAP repeat-containing protein 2 [Latimeria chalumnae]|eukprot:XP_006013512.1 PREDICTED: baculoviral IAP repeat-containing protein 2 [Latimeria chalumnae]
MNIVQSSPFLANLISDGNMHVLHYDLSCELFRFSTFANFPSPSPVSERSLARAGFYYTGTSDKVKCFSCGLMLDNWQREDNIVEKHKRLFPSCNFIQSLPLATNLGSSSHSAFSPLSVTTPLQSSMHASPAQNVEQIGYYSTNFTSFPTVPLNSRRVEDMLHHRPDLCNSAMSSEESRLQTYQNWPLTFLSPAQLVKAGFYYVGPGDKVACFACGGQLNNWEPRDCAMSEHKRHFPTCSFVLNEGLENKRPEDHPLSNIANPGMHTYISRVQTFTNWPSRIPVRPEQLARAGFYYVGRNDDVKCFCCDGGLRCWESGDDPWVEHAKWFPSCEYLLVVKGQEFVYRIQARFPHLLDQLLAHADTTFSESSDPPVVHFGSSENRSEDAIMMNTPVVKAALEMGFDRKLIKQTVQSKILVSGENYKMVQELVADLLTAEDENREEEKERRAEEMAADDLSLLQKHRIVLIQRLQGITALLDSLKSQSVINSEEHESIAHSIQATQQSRELIDLIFKKGNAAAKVFRNCLKEHDPILYQHLFVEKTHQNLSMEDLSGLPMEEQLRRLQEERTCKVCMDKDVSIVFIPCGHLAVCQDCAPSLRKCPICRGVIKGTVRTFLS